MKKVRWGVLGTANIATGKVLPAMQQGTYCDITAIASRSKRRRASGSAARCSGRILTATTRPRRVSRAR